MKIIANHAHLMPPNSWREGDVKMLLDYLDAAGIDMAIVFPPFVCQVDNNLEKENRWAMDIVKKHSDRLASKAKITSSSQQEKGKVENILSGQTRTIDGPNGAGPKRILSETNRWISDPKQGFPAWLELQWEKPVEISQVMIIFDTDLHRMLTLSHSDETLDFMLYGRPQPETVKDYKVDIKRNGVYNQVIDEKNNYQRRRLHKLDQPVKAVCLKITLSAAKRP